MLDANLRGAPGRKKRWDYWCVQTDEVVVSFVYADVDYAGLANVWVLDRASGEQATAGLLHPFGRGLELPDQVCTGVAAIDTPKLCLTIDEQPTQTRINASGPAAAPGSMRGAIEVDVRIDKPEGHESLNVVIPWSDTRFQFTSKQNTRPATGTVRVGERTWVIDEARDGWGVQDLGRGVWPYRNRWNWAAASGRSVDGRVVGLQFGGKWTVGTGATENALCIDGRLIKISDELDWQYSWNEPMSPWQVRTPASHTGPGTCDVTLTPTFDRYDVTDLKVLKMEVHQCFGTWAGTVVGHDGETIRLDGIRGFAEEARNRW